MRLNKLFSCLLIFLFSIGVNAQQWTEVKKYTASDRSVNANFGDAMYVSGDQMIVGATGESFDENGLNQIMVAGAAYIFKRINGGDWVEEQKLAAPSINRNTGRYYGWSVAIHGDFAVVGMPSYDYDTLGLNYRMGTGLVYIYQKNAAGVWQETQRLQPHQRNTMHIGFGSSLAMDDDYLMIGAPGYNHNAGAIYVYKKDFNGVWNQLQLIHGGGQIRLGTSISLSGDYGVTGAIGDFVSPINRCGSINILEKGANGVWTKTHRIFASDAAALTHFANFGISVAIDGDNLVVGDEHNGRNFNSSGTPFLSFAGSAYFFERNATTNTWVETNKVTPADRAASHRFGNDVSISGNMALIGSHNNTDGGGNNYLNYAGAAYLYKKGANGTWSIHQKITPADRDSLDIFGGSNSALFLSGNNAFVGAFEEDHDANGSNFMYSSGSIYHFSICTASYDTVSVSSCGQYISPSNKVYLQSGTYLDTIASALFCDSIITTNLTIAPNSHAVAFDTVCLSYTAPSGKILDSSGLYTDTIPNQIGCDSIIDIHLTVNKTFGQQTINSCRPITSPSGKLLSTTGVYFDTLPNSNRFVCDSIIRIDLHIPQINTSINQVGVLLTAVATGSTYQWLDCTNGYAPLVNDTNQSFTATMNGSYAVAISNNGCTDTSSCIPVISVGLEEQLSKTEGLLISPNPSSGSIEVEILDAVNGNEWLRFYDINGKMVSTIQLNSNRKRIDLSALENGVYFVQYRHFVQKLLLSR